MIEKKAKILLLSIFFIGLPCFGQDITSGLIKQMVPTATKITGSGVSVSGVSSTPQITMALWVNYFCGDRFAGAMEFANQAVEFRLYRQYFQPYLEGASNFDFEDAGGYGSKIALAKTAQWVHGAFTYSPTTKKMCIYGNGVLACEIDIPNAQPLTTGSTSLTIGRGVSGYVADARIYNRPLTAADIKALYESGKSKFEGKTEANPGCPTEGLPSTVPTYSGPLYEAWLNYKPETNAARLSAYKAVLKQIVIQESDLTVKNAGYELNFALNRILGAKALESSTPGGSGDVVLGTVNSAVIKSLETQLELNRCGAEGYSIKSLKYSDNDILAVAANTPAGLIYGTFALIRKLQLGEALTGLDIVTRPKARVRMVNHWDYFKGTINDLYAKNSTDEFSPEGNRYNSIWSWKDLASGNPQRIKDWARLLASAGFNAICPTELNFEFPNDYTDHMAEVKVMGDVFRLYGVKLWWTPSHFYARDAEVAKQLYTAVPDFGGYLLKMGSEGAGGHPGPTMVNEIARNLKPYGGTVLLRCFMYDEDKYGITGNEPRMMVPSIFFPKYDGQYDDNVILVAKGNPMDWDLNGAIHPLDGRMTKTAFGTEWNMCKDIPFTWTQEWKDWLNFDNGWQGVGSLNKNHCQAVMAMSMMSPDKAWHRAPLNMVNYYAMGRLSWDYDIPVGCIFSEWIGMTFSTSPEVVVPVKKILYNSDEAARRLGFYRGYRGMWWDFDKPQLNETSDVHTVNKTGIGCYAFRTDILNQYSPLARDFYGDLKKGEKWLCYFNFVNHSYTLSNGRTVVKDLYYGLDRGVDAATTMASIWSGLSGKPGISAEYHSYALGQFNWYKGETASQRKDVSGAVSGASGISYSSSSAQGSDNEFTIPPEDSMSCTLCKPTVVQKPGPVPSSENVFYLKVNSNHTPRTLQLEYRLNRPSKVTAVVYDIKGNRIETLINRKQGPGAYTFNMNTKILKSGLYIINFGVDDKSSAVKYFHRSKV